MSKGKVSIVVPMYNEQESLEILYQELNRVTDTIKDYEFEYLFVNDGSKDNTLQEIQRLATADDRVRYVSFPEILEKKLLYMQDYQMLMAIILQRWTQIYRIRRLCCHRCLP